MSSNTQTPSPRILVIGAGCGGITFAIALQRKYGYQNYVIYEKASDIGGTWRENTYPGCSSDVGMSFFSLSTDLRNWPSTHAYQPEILSYWRDLVHTYHLLPHIQFNHTVLSAEWDEYTQVYHVTVEDHVSKEKKLVDANIIVSAAGILHVPHWPKDLVGLEDKFGGRVLHSARWDRSVGLKGKHVAVIGNGPSAIQLIPQISKDPSVSVTNFIRTPSWVIPPMRETHSKFRVWLSGLIPGALRADRLVHFLKHELSYYLLFSNSVTRPFVQWLSTLYMRAKTPEKYFKKLIPKHGKHWMQASLFDAGYLDSLHQPNISLNFDGIKEIVKDGIITNKDETMSFDVIILATGFVADDYQIPIKGKRKQTVSEYYHASGGPTAYLGTSTPGFPNFYTLLGPNIATGFTSIIYSHEIQTNYILQLIKPILDKKVSSFDINLQATNEYNAKIQKRLSTSVFMQCQSWYRTGQNGKVSNIFPGSGTLMWWWLRRPVWDHYLVANGKRWQDERKARKRRRIFGGVIAIGVFAIGFAYADALPQVTTLLDWQF